MSKVLALVVVDFCVRCLAAPWDALLKAWRAVASRGGQPVRPARGAGPGWFGAAVAGLSLALAPAIPAQTVRDEAPLLDDARAPFVYEAQAELPSPPEDLAGYVSSAYRRSTDEFEQHALLERIKPAIERRIAEARATKRFMVKFPYPLPTYDFERQGFRTPLSETHYPTFDNGTYVVRFTNGADLDFIPFEQAQARYLEPALRASGRQAVLRIYGALKECREEPINGSDRKVIYLEATKAALAVGVESRFAGQKVLSDDPEAAGTPVPS
ncbi:MAG: DUF4852 domain-containing protein [Verrucomicrobia bacterium]|nr:DUF4852 domain-containing protein [Verrucomicrobiota bacterium]